MVRPLVPMYLHLIVSAIFPIYTGAHASLSRPSSAAKPSKRSKSAKGDSKEEDVDDDEQKMEGLSPMDAVVMPVLAGLSLAGLYYLIKWLEDPAILNKILNGYFSIFGLLSVARLLTDSMGTVTSFVFPGTYSLNGQTWEVKSEQRKAQSTSEPTRERYSPLPGVLSLLPSPSPMRHLMWTLRELPSRKFRVRAYIHKILKADVKIGPQGLIGLAIAFAAELYFNIFDKPWWLTNILGFSFAYATLQYMSPTTSWTGTLILGALFFYDIYFVFFTPLMVTVATELDIPAKLLFPRPRGPDEDPAKKAMSMLGLGDVVLPGMMIGFALRFDLYLFYLRKQISRPVESSSEENDETDGKATKTAATLKSTKAKWIQATGSWGERFWTTRNDKYAISGLQSGIFPKTYFHASLVGYIIGMLFTLGIMQLYGHAQPALLYLVPGVLGALWGTAFVRGDIKTLWAYSEAEDDESLEVEQKKDQSANDWKSLFLFGRVISKAEQMEKQAKENATRKENGNEVVNGKVVPGKSDVGKEFREDKTKTRRHSQDWKNELFHFSVSLPSTKCPEHDGNIHSAKSVGKSNAD